VARQSLTSTPLMPLRVLRSRSRWPQLARAVDPELSLAEEQDIEVDGAQVVYEEAA
jgi:hypothetical protein